MRIIRLYIERAVSSTLQLDLENNQSSASEIQYSDICELNKYANFCAYLSEL